MIGSVFVRMRIDDNKPAINVFNIYETYPSYASSFGQFKRARRIYQRVNIIFFFSNFVYCPFRAKVSINLM